MRKRQNFSYMPYLHELKEWDYTYDSTECIASLNTTRSKDFRDLAHCPNAVAWIVSHCNTVSDRERYVNELRRHIHVDIFGLCGNGRCESCPADNFNNPLCCAENIERDYMFYLSFENSISVHTDTRDHLKSTHLSQRTWTGNEKKYNVFLQEASNMYRQKIWAAINLLEPIEMYVTTTCFKQSIT